MRFRNLCLLNGIKVAPEGHRHARHGWTQVDCPYCGRKGKFHLGYNEQRGYFNCWRCGWKPLIDTIALLLRCSKQEAISTARQLLQPTQDDRPKLNRLDRVVVPEPLLELEDSADHLMYLRARGVSIDTAKLWELRAIPEHSTIAPNRLYIPIHDKNHVLVSWTARAIDQSHIRYITAKGTYPKSVLYGEHKVPGYAIIVVEGPTDVWRVGPGAVALLGTSITRNQLARIAEYALRVICLDNDSAGNQAARHIARALEVFPGDTLIVQLKSAKDPAEASEREITTLRKMIE